MFNKFSNEIISYILLKIDTPTQYYNSVQVCRIWKQFLDEYKHLFMQKFTKLSYRDNGIFLKCRPLLPNGMKNGITKWYYYNSNVEYANIPYYMGIKHGLAVYCDVGSHLQIWVNGVLYKNRHYDLDGDNVFSDDNDVKYPISITHNDHNIMASYEYLFTDIGSTISINYKNIITGYSKTTIYLNGVKQKSNKSIN